MDIGNVVDTSAVSGLMASLPTILTWVVTLLVLVFVAIGAWAAKKFHYWPFVKYRFRVEYFAPRGSREKPEPTFEDKFGIVNEGDEQYLFTKKERLILPYEYMAYLLGDTLYLNCHNRIEVFPFVPQFSTVGVVTKKDKAKGKDGKLVQAISFFGEAKFSEVLSDGPREMWVARHQKSKNKYMQESLFSKVTPFAGWAMVILFSFLLISAIAEQITLQNQQSARIAEANERTMAYIAQIYANPQMTQPQSQQTAPGETPDRPY